MMSHAVAFAGSRVSSIRTPAIRALTVFFCAALSLLAAAPRAQELPLPARVQDAAPAAWNEFLAWYRATPGPTDPGAVFGQYGARLKADGLTDAAIKERMGVIAAEAAKRRLDLAAIHFDKIYADPNPPFRTEASAYLVRAVTGRLPGTALDVGMGQGRNALYLASSGWRVTGYDISEGGMAAARAQADARKLSIMTVRATHADFDFGVERWDLIVMAYAFTPMDDQRFLQRVRESLKPGGIVVVEQFNAAPDKAANKGPANALLKSFDGLRVIHYEDTVDRSEWGGALCRIGRMTAEKDTPPSR